MTVPAFAAATGGGGSLVQGFTDLLSSNVALLVGLALALFGLYEILVAQNTGVGVGMVVFGLIIAFVPNIFDGLVGAVKAPLQGVGTKAVSNFGN
ncbi:MAG TPA: hypothetical protein VHP58_02925 [Alphaproteobacteria bacterium]|nr:hypothetical protein [Alphaproteobacteria bacterium]